MSQREIRVLLAEDDRRVRSAMAGLFRAASGFRLVAAFGEPDAAADYALRFQPDVAMVDLRLPDPEDGLALVRTLRRAKIPVLALSAQDALRPRALRAGASSFLGKGSAPEAVLEAVRAAAAADPRAPILVTDRPVYPESPRWHRGELWFSDVHAFAVKAVDSAGRVRTVFDLPGRPAGLGFLPDGRLLVAGALDRCLWSWDGGSPRRVADLGHLTLGLLNDMVVDGTGRAFVGDTGFNLMAGERPRAGQIILVEPDSHPAAHSPTPGGSGSGWAARVVSREVMFPNGAAVSPEGDAYWVAETAANRISRFDIAPDGTLTGRRTVAELPAMPDGLCLDAEGALWVALLQLGEFWRILPDGEVAERLPAADAPPDAPAASDGNPPPGSLAVACVLGGDDRRSLFLCSARTTMADLARGKSAGLIHSIDAEVPGAGWP